MTSTTRTRPPLTEPTNRQPQQAHATTDQTSKATRQTTKSRTADPRITIRRNDKHRKADSSLLILRSGPERGYLPC